jgi:hypothetical protein
VTQTAKLKTDSVHQRAALGETSSRVVVCVLQVHVSYAKDKTNLGSGVVIKLETDKV